MKTISDNIHYYRNLNGWSQEEIADKLDVSLPTYSRIERNIHGVSLKRIEQLAVIFGITLTELVSFGNKKPTENEITALRKTIQEKDKEIMSLQQKIRCNRHFLGYFLDVVFKWTFFRLYFSLLF